MERSEDKKHYAIENRKDIYQVVKRGLKDVKIPYARISDEEFGNLNIVIKVDMESEPKLDGKGEPMRIGLAEVGKTQVKCTFRNKGKTETTIWKLPYENRLDTSDYPIAWHPQHIEKAFKLLQDTPFGIELNKYLPEDIGYNQKISRINEMLESNDPTEQIFALKFRELLLEHNLMPLNEDGTLDTAPFDIPYFNVADFIDQASCERPGLMQKLTDIYPSCAKTELLDFNDPIKHVQFIKNLNALSTENPALFIRTHNYLVDKDYIAPMPLIIEMPKNAEAPEHSSLEERLTLANKLKERIKAATEAKQLD
ncbi:hypothetical protein KY346_04245 [Candidatus Woesearchaeota archaeon]|nr:hypothetical protein [Candidatus Woesearchaeota archaeon]